SHMPASSWALPPYASATPRTTGTVPGPLADSPVWPNVPALAALSRNVVSAKAASPSGPGSAGDHAPVTSAAAAGSRRSGSRLPMAADSITLSFLQARARACEWIPPDFLPPAAESHAPAPDGQRADARLAALLALAAAVPARAAAASRDRLGLGGGVGGRRRRAGGTVAGPLAHLLRARPGLGAAAGPRRRLPAGPASREQDGQRHQPERLHDRDRRADRDHEQDPHDDPQHAHEPAEQAHPHRVERDQHEREA